MSPKAPGEGTLETQTNGHTQHSRNRNNGAGLGACALGWVNGINGPGGPDAVGFGARVTLAIPTRKQIA